MTLSSKDKRKINTASLAEVEDDTRTPLERVEDKIGEVADEFGWNWVVLDEDNEFDFMLQRDRYTIFVLLDKFNGNIENAKIETALFSDIEIFQAIRS